MAEQAVSAATGEAYVSGALTAVEDGAPIRLELLGEIAAAAGLRPYLPHRTTDPITAANLDPRTVYDIDRAQRAVSEGRLFGAGLRDLVGRHALRGPELAAFVARDILELPAGETARLLGLDGRATRRHVAAARGRVGLAEDAEPALVGQWLVTELIAPPTRALQLQLFQGGRTTQ